MVQHILFLLLGGEGRKEESGVNGKGGFFETEDKGEPYQKTGRLQKADYPVYGLCMPIV
jgi:hypothetical protein